MVSLSSTTIAEIAISILISGSLFALVAVGFSLVYRVTKILHLAHGVVVLGSGYALWWAATRGASFTFAVVFALAVSLAIGWFMHTFVYEHLRRRGKVATTMSLIATLALLLLGQNVLLLLFGSGTRYLFLTTEFRRFVVFEATVTSVQVAVIGVSLGAVLLLALFLRRSRLGKAMRAVADNETIAEVVGIRAATVRLTSTLVASFLGGMAGILYALEFNLESSQATQIALKAFYRAVVGGIGSIPGAILGSFLLETFSEVGAFFFSAGFESFFTFVIVFLVLLFRPRGLFGEKVKQEDI